MSKGILVDSYNNIVALKMVWRDASSRGTNNSNANNNNNSNNSNNNGPSRRTIQSQEPTRTTRTTTAANSGGRTTSTNSRNRGANAANHNRRGHTLRLLNNKASVGAGATTTTTTTTTTSSKRTMNTKRPPRWEREGDKLYAEVTKELDAITYHDNDDDNTVDNNDDVDAGGSSSNIRALLMQLANINNKQITPNDVCQLLEPWTTTTTTIDTTTSNNGHNDHDTETVDETITVEAISLTQDNVSKNNNEQNINNNGNIQNTKEAPASTSSIPKNFLWGTLPVGPVLAQRLYNSGRQIPTSVQIAAFPILSSSVPMTAQQQQQQQHQQQSNNGGYNSNSRSNRGRTSSNNINSSSRWTSTGPTTAIAATTRSNKTKSKINNTTRNKQRINGIIASPTGTGKTLAYLLPLLCTSPGGQQREGVGGVLIVTPTLELACQIQREVDVLWPPLSPQHSIIPPLLKSEEEKGEEEEEEEEEEQKFLSSLFVVGDVHQNEEEDDDDNLSSDDNSSLLVSSSSSNNISPGRMILRSIEHTTPTIIAGTPKMLRALYKEAGRIVSSEREGRYSSSSSRSSSKSNNNADDDDNIIPITPGERATATALLKNLRAIVLDEADRLLRTEAVAREMTERKNRKAEQRKIEEEEEATAAITNTVATKKEMANNKKRPPKLTIARQTQTEYLLRDIPVSLDAVQIICASATVGRTMRRQLMQILNKNSADAAATLITGSDDLRVKSKDMDKRKSVLLPERLQHAYRVVTEDDTDVTNTIEQEEDEEVDNVDDANEEEFTFDENIGTSKFIMPSVRNEDKRIKQTINALWSTMMMSETKAKPIIIFPGRLGVERVQQELLSRGLTDVRTLRNLDGKRGKTPPSAVTEDSTTNNKNNKWNSVPVYIIGERFARGLDLPEVEYVFMLSPPSSAAGYAHMAGRTGRSGRTGLAFTLVRPRNNEVQRLAAIADALGLKFMSSMSGVTEKVEQQ
jgi:superfamily II DNA/RNA helicase